MSEQPKLTLAMQDLTLGDMELFEEATGEDIMEVLKPKPVIDPVTKMPVKDPDPEAKGRPLMQAQVSAKAFIGLVFIAMRKANPELTVAEVKAMKLSDLNFSVEETEDGPLDSASPASETTPEENAPSESESSESAA